MKKYLMILSSISAIGIGAIANTINTEATQKNYSTISSAKDFTSYDITDGSTAKIQLTNALTLFTELNNFHKENNVEIKWPGVPGITLKDEYGNMFLGVPFQNILVLHDLINSDSIEFKENTLQISSNDLKILLTYKIGDEEKTFQLGEYTGYMPLLIDNMEIDTLIPWTY